MHAKMSSPTFVLSERKLRCIGFVEQTLLIEGVSSVRHVPVCDSDTTLTHVITLNCHFFKIVSVSTCKCLCLCFIVIGFVWINSLIR